MHIKFLFIWDVRKAEIGIDGRRERTKRGRGIKIKEQIINS
jgi:hypothetical protein